MQIIGARKNKLIAELTVHELAILCGFSSVYSDEWKKVIEGFGCSQSYGEPKDRTGLDGFTVDVESFGKRVRNIRDKETKAKDAHKTLLALSEALSQAWPSLSFNEID